MKSSITLKLDSDLLRQLHVVARERGTSIDSLLSAQLEEIVRKRGPFAQAKSRALARLRKGFDLGWTPSRSRDKLHER